MILSYLIAHFALYHAIYVSVTEIKYQGETNKLEISVKMFTNDLEDAIYNQTKTRISLRTIEDLDNHASKIENYVNQCFSLKMNDQANSLKLLRAENEGDATWSYWEVPINKVVSSLEIQNQVLTELFAAQSNVVTLNINGEKRFLRFTKSSHPITVDF